MSDLIAGLGVALVLEGAIWALAPNAMRRMLAEFAALANAQVQPVALAIAAFGVFLVWLARG